MIKTVARPFIGKEKYKDYKLCYVRDIPETITDLTEESKAWKKTAEYRSIKKRLKEEVKMGERNSIYSPPSPLIYRIDSQEVPNPRYHRGTAELYAYFTDIPLVNQTGDHWDYAPYEYNSGEPYEDIFVNGEYMKMEHNVIKVPFCVNHGGFSVKQPKDYGGDKFSICG